MTVALPAPGLAQDSGPLRVSVNLESGALEIRLGDLFEEDGLVRALHSGLPLRPMEAGRYYYLGQFEVETLSLSDLDELQRWLRGDLATAVNGDERVGTALGRGAHRVLVRMLGIPARRYRVRTERFTFEARDPA